MWSEERGFGFLTPAGGGEDVFIHRSAVPEGVTLSSGQAVKYQATWDEKKKKDRATSVVLAAASSQDAQAPSSSSPRDRPSRPSQASQAQGPRGEPQSHNIVGAFGGWEIHRQPMTSEGGDGKVVRHRLTIRSDAPKGDGDMRREEFQIVGDGSWDQRVYPAGKDSEEVVVLRPGNGPSNAASERGKGHGRNWAVDGRPGTSIDIIYDSAGKKVSCELANR